MGMARSVRFAGVVVELLGDGAARHGPVRCGAAGSWGCSDRLELDFGPERECPGLEGQPGRRVRRVGELPAPPGVDIAVVADVAEQHLHVQEVA